jgi:peptidoglycan/LPS O-acetylase OafA/YrhL
VLLVVVYHAHIGPFSGGYIGVDVFFVVSGFLITSLLLAEVGSTGTIDLPSFWARRARRLLPASMLVVVVTLVIARMWYDPLLLGSVERDALAATGFSVNIVFAYRAAHGGGGYFDTDLAKSPLLHFWSLAVEEQFYLVWPLLIWFLARTARRLHADLTTVMTVLWLGSFLACVALTDHSQPWAFYSLPTRAWELLTGAVLAVSLSSLRRIRRRLAAILTVIGVVTVVVASVVDDSGTPFPGVAALAPALGTALILAGCSSRSTAAGVGKLLGARPLVWVGQRSYAIYLWHWPALVLAGAKWGPLSVGGRLAAIAVALVVAAVSYAFIEDPLRHLAWLRAAAHRSLALGVALLSVVALVAGLLLLNPPRTSGGGEAAALTLPPIDEVPTTVVGTATTTAAGAESTTVEPGVEVSSTTALSGVPAVVDVTSTSGPPSAMDLLIAAEQQLLIQGLEVSEVPSNLDPSLSAVRGDLPSLYDDGCVLERGQTKPPTCVYGDANASTSIAILGDSHAAQWFPALQSIARKNHWRLLYFAKRGCPPSEQPLRNGVTADCDAWRTNAVAALVAARPTLTIFTGYHYLAPDGAGGSDEIWQKGLITTITALGDLGSRVLILGDTATQIEDIPTCLAQHLRSVGACVSPRSYAVRGNRLQVEQQVAAQFGAATADTSDWLCTPQACPVIIGNLLVYRDRNHLTPAAAEFLAPLLEATLTPLVSG